MSSLLDLLQLAGLVGVSLVAFLLVLLYIIQKATTSPLPVIRRHKEETKFLDPAKITTVDFPSIDDEPTLNLSVIIPAYDEEKRLPVMLEECLGYLEKLSETSPFTYEVILVSDGSRDGTVALGLKYSKKYTAEKFRVLDLVENRGKGGAVRLGMLSARGKHLLFADADGATKFPDLQKLQAALSEIAKDWREGGLAIGSRAHLEEASIATRSFFRTILMHGFHILVWLLAVRTVRDTQCGFKLLTRSAARLLFSSLHVERWAFDVELLYLAEHLKIPIQEIAVNWTEIEGSKLAPFWSWLQMGRDLFLIWFRYTFGIWQVAARKEHSS